MNLPISDQRGALHRSDNIIEQFTGVMYDESRSVPIGLLLLPMPGICRSIKLLRTALSPKARRSGIQVIELRNDLISFKKVKHVPTLA